jgi:hypothetical protein
MKAAKKITISNEGKHFEVQLNQPTPVLDWNFSNCL